MLRILQTDNSTNEKPGIDHKEILYGAFLLLGVLALLLIIFLIFRRLYRKYHPKKRRESQTKLKKTEGIKSIYDDKFGIIENEHENIRDKSMIKEFLEANIKKDDPNAKKDDKNFYISAKNVFNIEGEESEYHYDTAKKYSPNREISRNSSIENEEEMGQFSQDLENNHEEIMKTSEDKHENSILNVLK